LKLKKAIDCVKNLILFDDNFSISEEQAINTGLKLIRYKNLMEEGQKSLDVQKQEPKPNSVFFIGVTSGTTKEPKLVMLTHTNFISGQVCQKFFGFDLNEKDSYYSYAPLSHVIE
jgi:long-chain acyl-CoA synthetase